MLLFSYVCIYSRIDLFPHLFTSTFIYTFFVCRINGNLARVARGCQRVTATLVTEVISTHVHKITSTFPLWLPAHAAPHQAHQYLLTLNIPSSSGLPFTYLNQARPIVLTCVISLPQMFLFLHRSSRSTYLLQESKGLLPLAQPSGSCLIMHYSPLVTS